MGMGEAGFQVEGAVCGTDKMSFPGRMREAVRPGAERDKLQRTWGREEEFEGLPAREPLIFCRRGDELICSE